MNIRYFWIALLLLGFGCLVNQGSSNAIVKRLATEESTADMVSKRINSVKGPLGIVASGVKALQASSKSTYNLLHQFQKILGVMGPGLMIVSIVLSVVSAFLPKQDSEELKFMKENFEIVINGMTRIENKLDDLEHLVMHESTKTAYGEYQRTILTLYEDWESAVKSTKPAHEEQHRAFFLKQYELHYKHAALNLLRAMTGYYDGELNNDLLGTAKARYKCDGFKIRKLCATVTQTIVQGLTLESAYYSYKEFPERVDELKVLWEQRFQILEDKCEYMVNECQDQWKTYADPVVKDIYGKYQASSNEVLAKQLYTSLTDTFGQRAWFVFVYDQKRGFEYHGYDCRSNKTCDSIYTRWHENNKMMTVVSFDMDEIPEFENLANVTTTMKWINEIIIECDSMIEPHIVPAAKQLLNLATFAKTEIEYGKFIYAIKADLNLSFFGEKSRYIHKLINPPPSCPENQFLKFHMFQLG